MIRLLYFLCVFIFENVIMFLFRGLFIYIFVVSGWFIISIIIFILGVVVEIMIGD